MGLCLTTGDAVIVIKDLPVRGVRKPRQPEAKACPKRRATRGQALEQFAVITQFAFPDVSVLPNPGSKLAQFRELRSAFEHQSRHPPASVSSKRNDAVIGIHVAVLGEAELRGGQCR
jgi:hypothetical protein